MYVCIVCGIVGKAKFLFGDVGQVSHKELAMLTSSSSSIACLQVTMNMDIYVTLPSFLPSFSGH